MAKRKFETPNEPPNAMAEEWEDFKKAVYENAVEPVCLPVVKGLTRMINWYIRWVTSHAEK